MKASYNDMNHIVCVKQIFFLLLLAFYSFANGENAENYSNKINCVVSEYIYRFLDWEELLNENLDRDLLKGLIEDDGVIERRQIISARQFIITGDKGERDCLWIEIWKMASSADAKRLFDFINEMFVRSEGRYYLEKPPKACFAFDNFVIWANACSFATQFNVREELNKIINICFE
jgi:hypothetical protein